MQEGPKLLTSYSCTECTYLYLNYYQGTFSKGWVPKCRKLDRELEENPKCCTEFIKTPIDCPLLGKVQEYDVRFDKDVLMRNL